MDLAIWRKELLSCIRDISNPDELERLWSGADKSVVWSYDEATSDILDLYELDEFLSLELEKSGLTQKQLLALRRFRDAFVDYSDKGQSDWRVLLSDSEWINIMSLAKEFISIIE